MTRLDEPLDVAVNNHFVDRVFHVNISVVASVGGDQLEAE